MDLEATFGTSSPVIGMIHLPPLPGAPRASESLESLVDRAIDDLAALEAGGVDGVIVENFGDVPFYPDHVPDHVVAAMTRVTRAITRHTDLSVGVNVLRNDATAAVSIAHATAGEFVRINVHTGARVTDQGLIEGRAHESLRLRDQLDADVDVVADVAVKHSAPVGAGFSIEESVTDQIERGLADALVVSGTETGGTVERSQLEAVRDVRDERAPGVPIFVGSGVSEETADSLLAICDGLIVGTAFKAGGVTTNPVDHDRVERLVEQVAAR